MSNEAKFIPVDTKVGQFLSEGNADLMDEDICIGIFEEEYDSIEGKENTGIEFKDLESIEPKGRCIAYVYDLGMFVLMTKEEFYKEYDV